MAVLAEFERPTECIRHEIPNTELFSKTKTFGKGTLYITEQVVTWLSNDNKGINIPYTNIVLHAICRDKTVFPHDCLFMHTDADIPGIPHRDEDSDDEDVFEPRRPVTELMFVPDDKETLNSMYQTMCNCQALHPDPADEFSPDEFFFGENEDEDDDDDFHMAELQISNNQNGNAHDSDLQIDPDTFEDAEEN